MGQESSTPVDEHMPTETLEARTVEAVAKYIKEGRAKAIVVMTGAGISTAAGIPDFRSPDTGLYSNLAKLNLPFPEAVFDIAYFRTNPKPFYALAKELYPGKFRPTIAHSFVQLLSEKSLLLKLFTQNIDCLEREAGVPDEKIIEAHGSFAKQRCIDCKTLYPNDLMRLHVAKGEVPHCITPQCNGLVKPDIVFFGEQLPAEFFQSRLLLANADLCIIMGTSLTVQPFASLPQLCSAGVPRVLINKEVVGGLGTRADDVLVLGDCNTGVRELASALGWRDELENLWEKTGPLGYLDDGKTREEGTADEKLENEINQLTAEIDKTLKVTIDHTTWLKDHLSEKHVLDDNSKAPLQPMRSDISNQSADAKSEATERAMLVDGHNQKSVDSPTQDPEVRTDIDEARKEVLSHQQEHPLKEPEMPAQRMEEKQRL